MKSLYKELVTVLKDKDIIILLILGPIFLTLLIGGVYVNSNVDDIPIAILDEDNSSLSRMIIQQFDENNRFKVSKYAESSYVLKELINSNQIYMGVHIPKDFNKDVTSLNASEILLYVDGTNIVVGNNSYAAAVSIIQTITAKTQIKILEGKDVLPNTAMSIALPFNIGERILFDPGISYLNYMLLGFVAVFLQQVIFSGVGISTIKYTQNPCVGNSFWAISKDILLKIIACSIFALGSILITIIICMKFFNIPISGGLVIALLFCEVFSFAISCPAIIISCLLKEKFKFLQIAYMLSLPTFLSCGYVWPIAQMPALLTSIIKILWPLIFFARPFDEMLIKGVIPYEGFIGLILYFLLWFPLAIFMIKRLISGQTQMSAQT